MYIFFWKLRQKFTTNIMTYVFFETVPYVIILINRFKKSNVQGKIEMNLF